MLPPANLANARYVLRFPGGSELSHVNHGIFWPKNGAVGVDLGTGFWWDGWARPWGPGYWISDGYGGAHSLLFGPATAIPGVFTGNVNTSTGVVTFGSDYRMQAGEWLHWTVAWRTAVNTLYLYVNGILDGTQTVNDRLSLAAVSAGDLYVGGSDHINGNFDLAFLRAWDRDDMFGATNPVRGFIPERFPGFHTAAAALPCDFWADYTLGFGNTIPDLAPQGVESRFGAGKDRHPGVFANVSAGLTSQRTSPFGRINTGRAPYWVRDSNGPFGRSYGSPAPVRTLSAVPSVPANALIYDSFTRQNQNHAFQTSPVLGSTEGGSLGVLAWTQELIGAASNSFPGKWGVHDEYAVVLSTGPTIAHVESGTANHDVRISRRKSGYNGGETAVAYRIQDRSNFYLAHYVPSSDRVLVFRVVAGTATQIASLIPPASWTVLRVTAVGMTHTIFCDATQAGQLTGETTFQSATRVGMGNEASAPNGLWRGKHFTVYAG